MFDRLSKAFETIMGRDDWKSFLLGCTTIVVSLVVLAAIAFGIGAFLVYVPYGWLVPVVAIVGFVIASVVIVIREMRK